MMKRSGPLHRRQQLTARTPLTCRTPLLPSSSLQHGGGLRRVPFRPQRPTPPSSAKKTAKGLLAARADGRCEGCGRAGPVDPSHRIAAGVGGPWHVANLIALCRDQHRWLHLNPAEARDRFGWRLESTDDFLTRPAWIWGREWCLLLPDGGLLAVTDIPDEEAS